ncbi:amidohydrolase family protein [Mesonia mobilis]|uniref:Cytosine deaminase n=1 Tax=Mesonia mobilis TaxID=369791 RepID=A0ABQ3BID5_9FLAO|nr:amidohydrolase family protein [Mesonia mobilis]MBQ0737306.1 amidohydrolase family protein [Aquimarina celericrescens]GGZ46796.1 cytosine deaminase [Mesonia mobilis]
MDDDLGELIQTDILVENGKIKKIGEHISASSGIQKIDGSNHIVMPGLMDNHWHTWTSLLKSMSGNSKKEAYFKVTEEYGKLYQPETMYLATKFALAEAIHSGITTINDFNHNARNAEFVWASFEAIKEMGLKGRVSYGYYRDLKSEEPTPFSEIENVLQQKKSQEGYEDIKLGFGSRAVGYPYLKKDWEQARALNMPIAIHASSTPKDKNQIQQLSKWQLLGNDVNIIHANAITDEEITAVKNSGASITMTPYSEMRIGFGFPQVNRLVNQDIRLGVGVDSTALSGSSNLLNTLKLLENVANAQAMSEFGVASHRLLKMATIDAAKILGISDQTGSITEGKQADLIMINRDHINLSSGNKLEKLVIEAAQNFNIDFVASKGKILKQNGELTQIDEGELKNEVNNTFGKMTKRLN